MILPGPKMMPMVDEGLPAIGRPWGGGYYIGDFIDGGVNFHLVVAPKASGQINPVNWKTTNTTTPGTTSMTNGLANSNAMNDASHPAAQFCRALGLGGYADWYLPAASELELIYSNYTAISGVDAFDSGSYWSSTQVANQTSYGMNFPGGVLSGFLKSGNLIARAIRRVVAL